MTSLYLLLSITIFTIGSIGMLVNQQHLIRVLLALELIMLAATLNFVIFSVILDDLVGQVYAICILAIAAAETSIGLALIVIYYRLRGGISIELIDLLKSEVRSSEKTNQKENKKNKLGGGEETKE